MIWSEYELSERIDYNKICEYSGDEGRPIKRILLSDISCSTAVFNELLDSLIERVPQNGLESISL